MTTEPTILVADDDPNDGFFMNMAFERAGRVTPLQVTHDGVEAIAYLSGEGLYADRTQYPLPALLLLDLNMPRKNGFDVLGWIRQQPDFKLLPVYILSASSRLADINQAYALGATSYIVKPGNFDELQRLARTIVAALTSEQFTRQA